VSGRVAAGPAEAGHYRKVRSDRPLIARLKSSRYVRPTRPTCPTYLARSTFSNLTLAAVAFGIATRWNGKVMICAVIVSRDGAVSL
jgi:hypothetical protein